MTNTLSTDEAVKIATAGYGLGGMEPPADWRWALTEVELFDLGDGFYDDDLREDTTRVAAIEAGIDAGRLPDPLLAVSADTSEWGLLDGNTRCWVLWRKGFRHYPALVRVIETGAVMGESEISGADQQDDARNSAF